jgi:hypothetical protein
MNEQVFGGLAIIVLVGFVAFVIYIQMRRARDLLEGWAEENGYEILESEHRFFRKGPYIWSGRGQVVYRVWVRDSAGVERLGWVRCGSWFAGVLSDKVESRWDGE